MLIGRSGPRPTSFAQLAPPALMARLNRIDLLSRKVLAGTLPGERRSKRRGRSVEFDDFRDYSPGDDLRHIDWNVYARLDRLMVKLFRAEEDLALSLIVDASPSMDAGEPSKLVYAHRLALALAFVGLVNQNRVQVSIAHPTGPRHLAPLRGRPSLRRVGDFLLAALADKSPSSAPTDLSVTARQVASRSPRGILVVISDFLLDAPLVLNAVMPAVAGGSLDAYAVRVVSPAEIDPALEISAGLVGDLRLIDIESGEGAEVTVVPETVRRYQQAFTAHADALRSACLSRGVALISLSTSIPVEDVVTATLRRGGLLR